MKMLKKAAAALCAAMTLSAAAFAAPLAPELQIDALAKSAMVYDGWFVLPERDKNCDAWMYAITDLDRNGRLEVLKVRRGWAEGGPLLAVKELGEDGRSLIGEVALDGTLVVASEDGSVEAVVTVVPAYPEAPQTDVQSPAEESVVEATEDATNE